MRVEDFRNGLPFELKSRTFWDLRVVRGFYEVERRISRSNCISRFGEKFALVSGDDTLMGREVDMEPCVKSRTVT